MAVTADSIRRAVVQAGLAGRPLCLHSSFRSFGEIAGGPRAVVDGLLVAGCTVVVPTFSYDTFAIPPPPHLRPPRNGWRYDVSAGPSAGINRAYTPTTSEIDRDMGAIPAAVVAMPERIRGDHPLCSFSAVGPRAKDLVASQRPLDVYAPLRALAEQGGAVVCAGVGLNRMTLLHLAERVAGRVLFRRWANDRVGRPMMVEVGGCSEGFGRFDAALAPVERAAIVGQSHWRVFPAGEALRHATAAIRADPSITHCADSTCGRCDDAVLGGPILTR